MLPFRLLLAGLLAAPAASLLPAEDPKPAGSGGEFKPLFDGKSLAGWVNVNCHPDTFAVKNGEIVTTGTPTGFLRTERQYENFELEFEWMHVEKEKLANSGLFVWGDPLPAVGTGYTRGIEVQVLVNYAPKDGWATSHGDIFSIWGAKCTPDRPHPTRKGLERCLPSENRVKGGGEWNHYKVIANDGALKLHVNGKEVSGVSKCSPRKGYLALESEGAECHFKNIRIKELPTTNPKPEECAKEWEGHASIFNGLDLKGWATEKGAWTVSDGVLRCAGKAELVTEKEFDNYELLFDWKRKADGEQTCTVLGSGFHVDFAPPAGAKPGTWTRGRLTLRNGHFVRRVGDAEPVTDVRMQFIGGGPVGFRPADGLEVRNLFVRGLKDEK